MDDTPKTRQEKKGKNGKKTKNVFNQKTIRLKTALFDNRVVKTLGCKK